MSDAPVILCVAGSPRRHGNSEQLLDACIKGVTAAGGVVDKLVVVEEAIHPCQGCNACSSTGECVIRDRMQDIYPRIENADAIIIGSPIFFASVPAVLKALYDRCQPFWARRWVLGEPAPEHKRPGALLIARGGGDPYGAESAVLTTRSLFAVLGVEYAADMKVVGVDSPSDMGRHPDALDEAQRIGAGIVERCAEGGK